MSRQFQVYANPNPRARRAYPLVVVLQADLVEMGSERIVAPLAVASELSIPKHRLAPRVEIDGTAYIVMTLRMGPIPTSDLSKAIVSLASYRAELVAAIDYLFLGV